MTTPTTTLKLMSTMALRSVLTEVIPDFEKQAGITVEIKYGATARLSERIRGGARGDILIAVAGSIHELEAEDILQQGARVDLVTSDVAMAVKLGAPAPDISTQEAFIATLRAARSFVYSKQGASGMYFASLLKRLEIDEELRPKATVLAEGLTGEPVARGEIELAVQQMSELMQVSGINIFAKLPPAVQQSTTFSIGIFKAPTKPEAINAFTAFMRTPAVIEVYKRQGLDPITPAKD
jgi:molybdate transport system substrate-binding protein